MLERIGRYRILRELGQGGMGVVYAARDEDLGRDVAVKTISEAFADETSRKRFRREARAAAALNHPNTCQVYEIGETDGILFIVMELLEGESLSERLERGPLPVAQAVPTALGILAALDALHERRLVHRDLKPANVFMTRHGVKILDFGLVRPISAALMQGEETGTRLTQAGAIVGTPRYMSPEQLRGEPVDGRADLFAVAALLFEMLTGRPVFGGRTMVDVLHATLHEQPPVLTGSPAIGAVDGVIRKALAKRPGDRHPAAAAMADELRSALSLDDSGAAVMARAMTRLIVLPFRPLRPDAEIDFLAFGLPDAIATTLSGLESLVVRSSLAGARYVGEAPDLRRIAAEAEVDFVLTGTLLRAGEQLRVATQLLEAPGGTVLWSHRTQVSLHDVFQVQDEIVQRLVASLSATLSLREQRLLRRDVPATARAYELYLRANELGLDPKNWDLARQLYLGCLEEDSRYAPAWARLGRICRVMAKFNPDRTAADGVERAEAAFKRALDLNPELALAHNLYAQFEVDAGRAQAAMVRLLERACEGSADPELFAGLVVACRYCGLLDASLAAHDRAMRLDPSVRTSVSYTYFMLGDYTRAAAEERDQDGMMGAIAALDSPLAVAKYREIESSGHRSLWREAAAAARSAIGGRREEVLAVGRRVMREGLHDPEARYYFARPLARAGEHTEAVRLLDQVVEGGFFCHAGFARDPWLAGLHPIPEFDRILRRAEARYREAAQAFVDAGGQRVLGLLRAP
jgi:non-specific serine/threonine protein kinase